MKISFRQGIIRHQSSLSAPSFLVKGSTTANTVDLIIAPEPTQITFAHLGTNYFFEENRSIEGAWGTDAIGSVNGPLQANGMTQYLFWDVNINSATLTRGWTAVAPVVSTIEPSNPVDDMHWFDLTTTCMKVFKKLNPNAPGAWIQKIRVFAGIYDSLGHIIPYTVGSQVGLDNGNYSTGGIILGANQRPLKQSDGTFVTTDSDLIVYQSGGTNIKMDMAVAVGTASEEIPKFRCVTMLPGRQIKLASFNNTTELVSGIVTEDLHQEEAGQVITSGIVRNEEWEWSASDINKPVFCGLYGEITRTVPVVGIVHHVGFVYDTDSIYFHLYSPVRLKN